MCLIEIYCAVLINKKNVRQKLKTALILKVLFDNILFVKVDWQFLKQQKIIYLFMIKPF